MTHVHTLHEQFVLIALSLTLSLCVLLICTYLYYRLGAMSAKQRRTEATLGSLEVRFDALRKRSEMIMRQVELLSRVADGFAAATPVYDLASIDFEPNYGTIGVFAFHFAPYGWEVCLGQHMSIRRNERLFSIFGTRYGGDGVETFALPDLRGRLLTGNAASIGLQSATAKLTAHWNFAPGLMLKVCINLAGAFSEGSYEEPFLGQILSFALEPDSKLWAECDGRMIPVEQNTSMFSLLGARFGGDGVMTFALPDLRELVPVHIEEGCVYGQHLAIGVVLGHLPDEPIASQQVSKWYICIEGVYPSGCQMC